MYHGSSLAACLGGNITSPSGWTSWSTAVVVVRVWVAQGIVVDWELMADVYAAFEVCESFMEAVHLHAVFNTRQGFVFSLDFGHDGLSVNFQLSLSLVVAAVLFDFGVCGRVLKVMGRFSQGMVGPSLGLE